MISRSGQRHRRRNGEHQQQQLRRRPFGVGQVAASISVGYPRGSLLAVVGPHAVSGTSFHNLVEATAARPIQPAEPMFQPFRRTLSVPFRTVTFTSIVA